MDLKKAFDQTVREIKREVNKKVLKVPEIEQKVLDATSNEPWGPHGALMADIAQATRNYNEYQMIMAILWKRLTDNGKNWRHVYKALTVLEFLVANGAERVIDDIREHSYQVQTLVDFQYVEASGKDQGSNVRKKAQTIVGIINDKERIQEVRQKAAANREKFKGMSSTGGIYKSSSYSSTGGSYGGDRYDRDDERYGGGSRYGGRDDEKYRDGDRYRDEDRYRRDGDRHGRDGDRYQDDDLGNDRDHDDDHYGSKVADHYGVKYEGNARNRDRDQGYEDDERNSTKARGKLDDYSHDERDGGIASVVARATKATSQLQGTSSSGLVMSKTVAGALLITSDSIEDFDDFDPRACRTTLAAPPPVTVEQDLFGETQVQPQPTTLPKYVSNVEYLLGESAFQSSFVAAPVSSSASFANLDQNGSFFQSSTLSTLSGSSNFTASEGNAFPPHLPLTTTSSNDFSPFSTASTNNFHTHGNSGTFPLELVNNINSSSSDFSSFSAAPNNSQSRADFFGDSTFSAFGATENKIDAMPAVTPAQQFSSASAVNHSMAHDIQTNSVKGSAKPPSTKDKFKPKSSVWADHLSSGLLDFNIAKPKNNPLAELGIHLDSSLTGTERKREVASAPPTKGKAMGSGSGLGIVGASILNPPLAPPIMGGGMGLGPGVSVGQGIGMGYGMNPGIGMAPRMGMNPGMAPSIGLSTSPAMMQGSGPGQTLGMGMDPSFGLGMGMGGYPNQQQQFGGYR